MQVADVKGKLSLFKSFWSSLPEFVCQDENVAAREDETNCLDGEELHWYANNTYTKQYRSFNSSHVSCLALCLCIRNISEVYDEEFIDFPAMVSALKRAYTGYQSLDDDSSETLHIKILQRILLK